MWISTSPKYPWGFTVHWAEGGVLWMPLGHSRVAVPPHADRGDPLCSPHQGRHRPPLLRYPGRLLRLPRDAGVAVPLVSWELVKDVGKSWRAAAAAGGSASPHPCGYQHGFGKSS